MVPCYADVLECGGDGSEGEDSESPIVTSSRSWCQAMKKWVANEQEEAGD